MSTNFSLPVLAKRSASGPTARDTRGMGTMMHQVDGNNHNEAIWGDVSDGEYNDNDGVPM